MSMVPSGASAICQNRAKARVLSTSVPTMGLGGPTTGSRAGHQRNRPDRCSYRTRRVARRSVRLGVRRRRCTTRSVRSRQTYGARVERIIDVAARSRRAVARQRDRNSFLSHPDVPPPFRHDERADPTNPLSTVGLASCRATRRPEPSRSIPEYSKRSGPAPARNGCRSVVARNEHPPQDPVSMPSSANSADRSTTSTAGRRPASFESTPIIIVMSTRSDRCRTLRRYAADLHPAPQYVALDPGGMSWSHSAQRR